jgi:hypothetical protein
MHYNTFGYFLGVIVKHDSVYNPRGGGHPRLGTPNAARHSGTATLNELKRWSENLGVESAPVHWGSDQEENGEERNALRLAESSHDRRRRSDERQQDIRETDTSIRLSAGRVSRSRRQLFEIIVEVKEIYNSCCCSVWIGQTEVKLEDRSLEFYSAPWPYHPLVLVQSRMLVYIVLKHWKAFLFLSYSECRIL